MQADAERERAERQRLAQQKADERAMERSAAESLRRGPVDQYAHEIAQRTGGDASDAMTQRMAASAVAMVRQGATPTTR